jgi:chromosome segregation protein
LLEERRISALEKERAEVSAREEQITASLQTLEGDKAGICGQLEAAETDSSGEGARQAQEDFRAVEHGIKEIEEQRGKVQKLLAQASQEVSELRSSIHKLGEQRNRRQLALERYELELGMLHEEFLRVCGEESVPPSDEEINNYVGALNRSLEEEIGSFQGEVHKLRTRLEREGEVDPTSIERYEEESARLESMRTQYADLEAAAKTLDRTIRQLKEISRNRFLATFEDVKQRFSELIPRLFGGGAGHLQLIDPGDPLASGVEIVVRPPGKRVSSMELLSGGEKALVATAVLIAMFLHRPSPVCVLDEVDAPLDEVNLERFLGLIKEISDKTQFLIITHNKSTMLAVGRLIGITMQESGVSTALSVTLAEAEREVERWAANA